VTKVHFMPLSSERTGNGIYETRVEAGVASDRARYSAVFPTFTRIAASRTVRPLASKPLARVSLSDVTTGFRPPCRPRAAAAARPALVRSRILARLGQDASPDMTSGLTGPLGPIASRSIVPFPTPNASAARCLSMPRSASVGSTKGGFSSNPPFLPRPGPRPRAPFAILPAARAGGEGARP
jgi:hypothetical protein